MKRVLLAAGLLAAALAASYLLIPSRFSQLQRPAVAVPPPPSPLAVWPWPAPEISKPHRGVKRWYVTRTSDGTAAELFKFDFKENAFLRLQLYDQDEDDATPNDDAADYYRRSVGHIVPHLNRKHNGRVVAAWNGPFFAYDRRSNLPHGIARHVGPVVLRGRVRHNVGNPRWTFGIRNTKSGPRFAAIHQPMPKDAERQFDFAVAGVQCLLLNGKPLRLQPYPQPNSPAPRQPVPSTPFEAGHIPLVDHMRTSRASMGWSQDSLYLLIVNEPDNELGSKLAVKRGGDHGGGWTLDDLQRFWIAFGAPNAINIDGGAVTQLAFLRGDGKYEMLPSRLTSPNQRIVLDPEGSNAPSGGTLMTFYVIDAGAPASRSN